MKLTRNTSPPQRIFTIGLEHEKLLLDSLEYQNIFICRSRVHM